MLTFNTGRLSVVPKFMWIIFMINMFGFELSGQVPQVEPDDTSGSVIIHQISITGNSITSKGIILRELNFREHDTIPYPLFSTLLAQGKQNIFNTQLFNFVTIDTSSGEERLLIDVRIAVVERWYIWPIPFFEISERNFNVWWESRDFKRLTYGIDFTFFNARGRNETLRLLAHFGFEQRYGFTYRIPYINKNKTLGTGFGASMEMNHELTVYTQNNKPFNIRNNSKYLKKIYQGFVEFNLRPDFFSTHNFRVGYTHFAFDTAVSNIPGFVINPKNVQKFFSLRYLYKNDRRDVQYYPLKGSYLDMEVNYSFPHETAHNSYVRTNMRNYLQLGNRWYWASGFTGKLSFERIQPYFLQRGLGYGRDYVRGYDYYVVDGQHYALLKSNIKFALIPQRVEKINWIRTTKFNAIPLALYVNAFVDMGYVYHYPGSEPAAINATNTLENSLLIGYGLGLDFTTYYDVVIRVEGAMNRMFQTGIYVNFIAPI
ncbi:MAG: hypothetical protein Q8M08_00690 [Bacteroidales bacterium]|nr:hypothetical protein [Bacteroidales bacterium]